MNDTLTPPDTARDACPVETVATRDPHLEQALRAARARGQARVAEILGGEDMLSAEAFAARLGLSPEALDIGRRERRVLGLDGAGQGFRFPAWQINAEGKP